MLTNDIAKTIVDHVNFIDGFVDYEKPIINITHSKSKNMEDVKICDFKTRVSGTHNPLRFDHLAVKELLNALN